MANFYPAQVIEFYERHPFVSFATSHERQGVGARQEEGNQCDGPHNCNPHFTPGTTPLSPLKDDVHFVQNVEGDQSPCYRLRAQFVLHVVSQCCWNHDLALRTWLLLLEGGTDDEIWLWIDGDEKYMRKRHFSPVRGDLVPATADWLEAASAISQRQRRIRTEESVHLSERRRRVQEADPAARVHMIAWIVASCKTMKSADASRGLSDREKWNLGSLIETWSDTTRQSPSLAAGVNDNVVQTVREAMRREGHSCQKSLCHGTLEKWVKMRSVLIPDQQHDVVYLQLGCSTLHPRCEGCEIKTFRLSHSPDAAGHPLEMVARDGVTDNFHYQPPRYLVFLWILWVHAHNMPDFRQPTKLWRYLDRLASASSPLLCTSTLKSVDLWLSKLPPGMKESRYLPWLNSYPEDWRRDCTLLSSHDWERAHVRFQETKHNLPAPVGVSTWIGAVILSMFPGGSLTNGTSEPVKKTRWFFRTLDNYMLERLLQGDSFPLPEVEVTAAVNGLRCAVQESHHTCYKKIRPVVLDWYASAVSLMDGTDHVKFIPLGKHCFLCKVAKKFRVPMQTRKNSAFSNRQQMLNALLQELASTAAQEGLRFNLPTGGFRSEGSSAQVSLTRGEHFSASEVVQHNDHVRDNNTHTPAVELMANGLHEGAEGFPQFKTRENAGIVKGPKAPRRPKGFLIKEIKAKFITLLEGLNVPILGLQNKQLPWTTLRRLLSERGWELRNWPDGVPLPGSGDQGCDDNKGINGLETKHLCLLYDAMKSETNPLGFQRITDATSSTMGISIPQSSGRSTSAGNLEDDHTSVISSERTHRSQSTIDPLGSSSKRPHGMSNGEHESGIAKRQRMLEVHLA